MRLILASASPRRAELLTTAGFAFDVAPAEVDETPRQAESPEAYCLRVARDKASVIASGGQHAGRPVLAADTIVVANGWLMGKPGNRDEARRMLTALSGRTHLVHTAVVLLHENVERSALTTTAVRFGSLSTDEIDWYLGTGEPEGKAGAYAIQGAAARFVEHIEGSWSNVVGLPVATVYRLLRDAGVVC